MMSMPGTSRAIGLFAMTLKEDAPDGSIRVDQYSRYVLLLWLLIFRTVCVPLRRKYPNLTAIQNAGFLREQERKQLEKHAAVMNSEKTLPLVVYDWINLVLKDTCQKGYFLGTADYGRNIDAIQALKKSGSNMIKFASKNIPVSLVQAVTIAIYFYGLTTVLLRQVSEKTEMWYVMVGYFPLPQALPYFLCYAWLKVGRVATDPFGEDEDDIDMVTLFHEHVESAVRLRNLYGQTAPFILQEGRSELQP